MTMARESFQMVSSLVRRETSMVYDEGKEYLVEARLLPLAVAAGCTVDEYCRKLSIDFAERRKALDALTINETSWFRDQGPYQAFTDTMLPALLQARSTTRRLRIWSAACSSGQEAYSIAMLLDQHLPAGWSAEILATDVSTAMLARVKTGRYSQVEMNRGMPATSLVRYFTRVGSEWEIVPKLKAMVTTRHLNLSAPYLGVPTFDLVLLRNVLIYFDKTTKADILRRMLSHVASDGYLLLGSSESTLDLPPDLAPRWRREQIGRVQAHRPTGVPAPRPSPASSLVPTGA